jgi:Arc-like DNA binding domain
MGKPLDPKDLRMVPTAKPGLRMGREAPKYLLRLPQEIRDHLQKEANLNGRSVNSEIVQRLQASIDYQFSARSKAHKAAESGQVEYTAQNDTERAFFAMFRRMSPEKQLALLSLFK